MDDFRNTQTRPFIVEFAGTPKAGKTTALTGLRRYLEAVGLEVQVVEEHARLAPVPRKRDPDFNVWTVTTTVAKMVEAVHSRAQFVLLDRGVLDALCWMEWHQHSGQLGGKERAVIDRFLLTRPRKVDLVLLMTVSPAEALTRDIASGRDRSASVIVGRDVLAAINRSIRSVQKRYAGRFPLVPIDTTGLDQTATLDRVVDVVLAARRAAAMLQPSAAGGRNASRRLAARPHGAATFEVAAPPTG